MTVWTTNGLITVVDAHRSDGKRYVVHAENMLAAFMELERVTTWQTA